MTLDAARGDARLGRPPLPAALLAAPAVAVLALVLALLLGGGAPEEAPPGLPDAGPVTGWAVPVARLAQHGGALLAVAGLLAGLLGAGRGGPVRVPQFAVACGALLWAAAAAGGVVLGLSEVTGRTLAASTEGAVLRLYVEQVASGRALLQTAGLAALVALLTPLLGFGRPAARLAGTAALLGLALLALLPPLQAGHAATAADHRLAVTAVSLHVVGAVLWAAAVGVLLGMRQDAALQVAAPRASALALVAFALVAVSGAVSAWTRLGTREALWSSGYGWLVVGKTALLVSLAVLGWAHRRRTLPALAAGSATALRRLVGVELLLMAVAVALGVALTRTG